MGLLFLVIIWISYLGSADLFVWSSRESKRKMKRLCNLGRVETCFFGKKAVEFLLISKVEDDQRIEKKGDAFLYRKLPFLVNGIMESYYFCGGFNIKF